MDVLTPYSLEEALEVRFTHPEATPVAGGTDLMVDVNARRIRPTAQGIGELATVAATPAIVAGRVLNTVPVTPDDLLGLREPAATAGRAPIPDVPGQQAIPEYLGLGLGQQELMKAR